MHEGAKEKRFLNELETLFTGADVEGDSGFVNLMRMKRAYFRSIRPQLMARIDRRAEKETAFREELFDKLYTFFHRYFCESGSIYFRHLPAFAKTYERVYADGQDVALSWKTQMLYYVKSDVLVRSMPVELSEEGKPYNTRRFYFDASTFEGKQNNEKRAFVFTFAEVKREAAGAVLHLNVAYSQKGSRTKHEDILKKARKAGVRLTEEALDKAIAVFRRQTEADFFINKDAKSFLREQFDLWVYQYIFSEKTLFEEKRIKQLQAIKHTAYDIIDFIAQFEDELRRVWEKPKFVRNVHYVVTLDKLGDNTLDNIARHKGVKAQIKEWCALGMVDDTFSMDTIFSGQLSMDSKNRLGGQYPFLPLDTKHFKSLEPDILNDLGNLDEALDGELVHSENWQALNTLQRRYREKVKCIYIDPPYNTGLSELLYKNSSKHSTWLSLIENRISLSKNMLDPHGIQCVTIDNIEFHRLRQLLSDVYGEENICGVVTIKNNPSGRSTVKGFSIANEYGIFAFKSDQGSVGFLSRTDTQLKQYNEKDENGLYQWRNFLRSGGENDFRKARPKLFYPLIIANKNIRIPSMNWNEDKKNWVVSEKIKGNEKIIYPDRNGVDYTWRLSSQSLKNKLHSLRIRQSPTNGLVIEIKFYLDTDGVLPKTIWDDKKYNSVAYGTTLLKNIFGKYNEFSFPKSIHAVEDCLKVSGSGTDLNSLTLDYFAGSGTTAHAVINLNREDGGRRKYLLIEMGEYFHTVLLPRIKKVIYSKDWKDGRPVSHEGSSHFLKYYTLEQYEETLRKSHYEDGEQLELDSTKSPFEQYVFFADDKLGGAVKAQKNGKLKINLQGLYKDIDIGESLANILGKTIRKRTADSVTFSDNTTEKTNPANMTEEEKQHFISLIKPYLWWGE